MLNNVVNDVTNKGSVELSNKPTDATNETIDAKVKKAMPMYFIL